MRAPIPPANSASDGVVVVTYIEDPVRDGELVSYVQVALNNVRNGDPYEGFPQASTVPETTVGSFTGKWLDFAGGSGMDGFTNFIAPVDAEHVVYVGGRASRAVVQQFIEGLGVDFPTKQAEVAPVPSGYRFLDSGAMYRITALAALRAGLTIDSDHEARIATLAQTLPVRFEGGKVWLGNDDVTEAIRTEEAGMNASRVSALPAVRTALVDLQHSFQRLPGLVADGRDMGTVVFPDAALKVFLTASAAQRAERRHKQLISKGISANIDSLRADLEARDLRDSTRAVAPLKPAEDAQRLDNSELTIDQSVDRVLGWWEQRRSK